MPSTLRRKLCCHLESTCTSQAGMLLESPSIDFVAASTPRTDGGVIGWSNYHDMSLPERGWE
eukprot:m.169773 g.169773  ORF g.169773 m.169773 type:complete len:62 (+) comp16672_c0_seq7:2982-3167(+)